MGYTTRENAYNVGRAIRKIYLVGIIVVGIVGINPTMELLVTVFINQRTAVAVTTTAAEATAARTVKRIIGGVLSSSPFSTVGVGLSNSCPSALAL